MYKDYFDIEWTTERVIYDRERISANTNNMAAIRVMLNLDKQNFNGYLLEYYFKSPSDVDYKFTSKIIDNNIIELPMTTEILKEKGIWSLVLMLNDTNGNTYAVTEDIKYEVTHIVDLTKVTPLEQLDKDMGDFLTELIEAIKEGKKY